MGSFIMRIRLRCLTSVRGVLRKSFFVSNDGTLLLAEILASVVLETELGFVATFSTLVT